MKVLMLNGSARPDGNTNAALTEIGKELEKKEFLMKFSDRSGSGKGLYRLRTVYGERLHIYG